MSQPGYGYGMPQGYDPALSFQHPQNSSFAPHFPNDMTKAAAQASLQHPRNMIPGLGLGFAASVPAQQTPWPRQQPGGREAPSQASPTAGQSYNHGTSVADGSEEGEVSEGGNEDLYDPREAARLAAVNEAQAFLEAGAGRALGPQVDGQSAATAAGGPNFETTHAGTSWPEQLANTARERSGSYSPHLSPQELGNADSQEAAAEQATFDTSVMQGKQPLHQSPRTNRAAEFPHLPSAETHDTRDKSIDSAKQAAREAILGLWPLRVRRQNFLDEGIDDAILSDLLNDLGLEIEDSRPAPQNTASSTEVMPAALDSTANKAPIVSEAPPVSSQRADAETAKPVDKSEERKDRIARRLAAKGSKPSEPAKISKAAPGGGRSDAPIRVNPPAPKAQSEKSKLLQQKMEALRKSRENLAQSQGQQRATAQPMETDDKAGKASMPDTTMADVSAGEQSPSAVEAPAQGPGSGKPSPSIPGLFLSSTSQPSLRTESQSLRRATPVSSESSAKLIQRPFGQRVESRPFLINVSDDEDDTEMDIDSPIQPSSPVNHLHTTAQRTAPTLRESSLTLNSTRSLHVVTPASVATPPRSSGNISGGEDLANMNKKIEAMKRKIAEAEARKKSKLFRQVSPANSHLHDSSRGQSVDAASTPKGDAAPPSAARSQTPVNRNSMETAPATLSQERPSRSRRTSHIYGDGRRSLSAAASERLPFIEARRKEQLLKLRMLQMQIAKVEQDLAEGMREEENLKQDLVSDFDGDENLALPADAPVGANDSVEESGAGSDSTSAEAHNPDMAQESREPTDSEDGHGSTEPIRTPPAAATGQASAAVDTSTPEGQGEQDDAVMQEAGDSSDMDSDGGSDDYEPPDAEPCDSGSPSMQASPSMEVETAKEEHAKYQESSDVAEASTAPPRSPQDASAEERQPAPENVGRELNIQPEEGQNKGAAPSTAPHPTQGTPSEDQQAQFAPYETPLQYFRAFRFHPEFGKSVGGGLRSLTYSNKIDVRKQVCPDELAGQACPRGSQCEFQHFENMRAPDEQILLQLGAASSYQAEQKQEYIVGLRLLLTDFRNRKVKDFDTISRGIVDYRAQFLKDRSKILPLGGVSI